jgi:acetate kinase
MKPATPRILTISGGSSRIKFALFEAGGPLQRILADGVEQIGRPEATLRVKGLNPRDNFSRPVAAPDHTVAWGGLDTPVFAGGIGEHAPTVRARSCDGLGFLGIALEETRNAANEGVIAAAANRVTVRVMCTDEEPMIASTVCRALGLGMASEKGIPPMRRHASLGRIRVRRAVSPHSEAHSTGVI